MKLEGKKSFILVLIAATLLFFLSYFIVNTIFYNKSYNFMVKYTSNDNLPEKDIVLVVIDDKSLFELGRWPWTRDKTLEIFDYFENYTKSKALVYDAVILAPDMINPEIDKKFFEGIKNHKKIIAGVAFVQEEFGDYTDAFLYNSLIETKSDIKFIDKRTKKTGTVYKSFTPFVTEYFKNITSLGVVNTTQDTDGYIRKVDQIIEYKDNFYPSLGLFAYSRYTGIKEFEIHDKFITGKNENYSLKIPAVSTPNGIQTNLKFYKPIDRNYSHEVVSASDVINSYRAIKQGKKPKLDPSYFDNKMVLIGANANAEALNDIKRTPVSDTFAGVDIQATNLNNLLDNKAYTVTSPYYDFFMVLFVFLWVVAFVVLLPVSSALLLVGSLMILYLSFAFIMYENYVAIQLIVPELFMLFGVGYGYSFKYLLEGRKKEKIQSAMSKYISKDVMENVVENIDSIKLGGKRAEVTVLFADIRGFTSMSENLSAVEVTNILNEYFSELVPIIESHHGILNKFMGDAVLAIFGEPIKDENHPLNAVKCANEMLKKVRILQEKWLLEGKPKIEIGIGISTGEVFVGNIGSENRLEYTVIGDTVNTASRIENYNKVYRTNFLISEQTYMRVQKYVDVIKIREVSIRGKAKKINIYEVLRIFDN